MRIRPYRDADQQQVIALWNACGLLNPLNNPFRDIERKLAHSPQGFLVGEEQGRVIASLMVGYDGHRGWYNYLAVSPECQKRGHARQLLQHAEAMLRAAGCPKINLQVRKTNSAVLSFYQKQGYGEDALISLSKRLTTDPPPESPPQG
jgi:ribosomal protein S18 acetylase RimI-like enzyme